MKKSKQTESSLSTRALLVHINISQWAGRRTDKQATETVIKEHKTNLSAGSYNKRLLPNATELEAIATIASSIRKYFYEQTLPWMTDGSRIISAKNQMKFATEIRKMISEFETAVIDFESAYPRLQAAAQKTLGGLYNNGEYPSHATIKNKFKIEVNYMPLPDVKDFRVEVSEAEKKAFVDKIKETESAAMHEVWNRLHTVVKAAAEKLAEPDAIFRESLLENVRSMCDMLPALNVSDDEKLNQAKKDIEKLISGYSSNSLREDKSKRADAAKKLKSVTDKMGAFMGSK